MTGLKRGTAKLTSYCKQWLVDFELEKKKLLAELGPLVTDVKHIGSTAISGIDAKPIIDILVGVKLFKDAKKLIKPLDKIGYRFYRISGREIFFAKGLDKKRTHYLHVVRYNGAKWKNDLLFCNFLIKHPARAQAYARLKRQLAKQFPDNRKSYTAGKALFIKETIRLAKRRF